MAQIKDEKQEYQYSQGWTSPSGHEFHTYETPENERMVVKHQSGAHVEFKADGSIFIHAIKDIHYTSSTMSTASDGETTTKGAEKTTNRVGTDFSFDCLGDFNLKCRRFNLEIGQTGNITAGEDFETKAKNTLVKGSESVGIEGSKSLYFDADEVTTRAVTQTSELGTDEDKGEGAASVINLKGHAIINNEDKNGGVTIASKGYLNLVCGQERIDIVGKYDGVKDEPSKEGVSTFTTKIFKPKKQKQDKSKVPGDYHYESDAGATYIFENKKKGSTENKEDGLNILVKKGDDIHTVEKGDQTIKVEKGKQTVEVEDDVKFDFKSNFEEEVKRNVKRKVGMNEDLTVGGLYTAVATKIFLN